MKTLTEKFIDYFKPVFDDGERLWSYCFEHKDTHRPNLCLSYQGKYTGQFKCWACGYRGKISLEKLAQIIKEYKPHYNKTLKPSQRALGHPCPHKSKKDIFTIWDYYKKNPTYDVINKSSSILGLTNVLPEDVATIIKSLGGVYTPKAIAFPMYNEYLQIVGLHLRPYKTNLRGSKVGVFLDPQSLTGQIVYITEGVTDLMCLLYLGYKAIGRFSATTTDDIIVKLVTKYKIPKIVIIPDNDMPGWEGAKNLREKLEKTKKTLHKGDVCDIIYVEEEYKDVREFVNSKGWNYVAQGFVAQGFVKN